MDTISNELLARYHMRPLEECLKRHPGEEMTFWKIFLQQTDYVVIKIAESNALGKTIDEDYTEILEARELCRQKINELLKQ